MWVIILTVAAVIVLTVLLYGKKIRQSSQSTAVDPVTGGLNGAGFQAAAEKQLKSEPGKYSLIIMELRNFPQICKSFGINDSERVLQYLHKVLRSVLGRAEPSGRLNRATFCFLMKNLPEEEVSARLKRIYENAQRFNQERSDPYYLKLCFGIFTPQSGKETLQEMKEKAGQMLDDTGDVPRYRFYRVSPNAMSIEQKRELLEQVERSLKSRDFIVYLQPMVRLGDSRIVGAEALVRWRHPQHGILPPDRFIPLLEEYHKIHRLDLYIFETVCGKLAKWKREGRKLCPVSINLSREDMEKADFLSSCAGVCQSYGIEPELMTFELQESFFDDNRKKLRAVIDEIHSYGFHCALDNFGRTSISLDMLRELDVDVIKLDGSFFRGENNTRGNRYIIEALLKLAAQMNILTVAEKIENVSQVQYLQKAACDMVQGSYYFQPMSIEEFEKTAYQDGELRYIAADGKECKSLSHAAPRSAGGSVVMFTYQPEEDRIVFSADFSPVLESRLEFSDVQAMFRGSDLIHENDRDDFLELMERCRREEGWVENLTRFYTSTGRYEWLEVHLHAEALPSAGGSIIFGTLANKNEAARWKEKADRDALTGLYNRDYFERSARYLLESGSARSGAIVFIDIDDFKQVNDTLGHMVGDDVLCSVAKRVLGIFRHTDIVARYGGDEFVVFVNGIERAKLEKRLAQLCEVFRFPYRNSDISYRISGSIGAAVFPEDGTTYQELLEHADCALYEAKEHGKDRFVLYRPDFTGSKCR